MIQPDFLKQSDKIGLIAPSRKVTKEDLNDAINLLQQEGFEVTTGNNLYKSLNQFSGTDNERAADLQQMMDDNSVKAIICARGGYGCMRIVDEVDFTPMMDNPKWLCGYSDITVLHSHIHTYLGMQSIHSAMAFNFRKEKLNMQSYDSLISALKGEQLFYEWQTETALDGFNKHRSITAPVVGGNLSMLYANIGTQSDIDTTGKILFLEDLDEYLYHIDRMMNALQRSGKLNDIAGLLIGGMTDMKDNETPFGKTAPEIIYDYVKDMEIPVAFSFPAGHTEINQALIFGCDAEFVAGENSSLKFLNNLTP